MNRARKPVERRLQTKWVAEGRGQWQKQALGAVKLWFWMAGIGAVLFVITFNLWGTQDAVVIVIKAIIKLFV